MKHGKKSALRMPVLFSFRMSKRFRKVGMSLITAESWCMVLFSSHRLCFFHCVNLGFSSVQFVVEAK